MAMFLAEFLAVIFNSILFQRQLFQRSDFKTAKKWGVPIMMCSLPEVQSYLKAVVRDINRQWLESGSEMLQMIMLTIVDEQENPIERWQFGLQYGQFAKSEGQLRSDLQKLLRQVHSSVSFMPLLRGDCSFRIAVIDASSEDFTGWTPIEQKQVHNAIEGEFQQLQTEFCTVSSQIVYSLR